MENKVKYIIEEINYLEKKIDIIWGKLITSEVLEGMLLISSFFIDIDKIINSIVNINESIKNEIEVFNILTTFNDLEKAMQVPDYIVIADLLEYEIKPTIKKWDKELNNILKV